MDVCTIIAKNYVAYARVLARSFAEHHPEGRFHVLVIDDFDGYIDPADEPFVVVRPDEIGVEDFERMATLYDVLELSTAVKPWLLRWLLARSPDDIAVYLDPDMRLYAPLTEMFVAVNEHKLVVSPHNVDPMPRDGKRPNEQDILIAGTYNLGFIGIGSGSFADNLLDWWAERLETDCIVDPARGFFVDQRWIDLVPGMTDSFCLLRDRGFNVAYWNVSSRPIARGPDGRWGAADVPLRLFHFSGFDPRRPHLLSKHQDRTRLSEHPALAELCQGYADELMAAGAGEVADWPYTYTSTASGIELNTVMRKVYGELVAGGEHPGSPFEPAGERRFLDALNAPAPPQAGGTAGVTRYLQALYGLNPDLPRVYPDLAGAGGENYVHWAVELATVEVPNALRPKAVASEPPVASPAALLGVNVAGYLNSELGVGEVARQAINGLDAAGVPVLPIGLPASSSRQGHPFVHRELGAASYPVNLVCVNADALPAFASTAGPRFFDHRHTIGWWWWEVSEFPERWMGSFTHVDEIWAGSRFVADTLAAISPVPVVHMPVPVGVPGDHLSARGNFGLGEEFAFLFSFDYNSVAARKNPLGTVQAFLKAFPLPGEAVLVLKSINAQHHVGAHEQLRLIAAGHPHVRLLDDYLAAADKDRLTASCDCYVSLHRSEGFGITMAEAMFLGKPVIATGYSGNLDFMNAGNSWLVDHELVPIGPGADPYPQTAHWAEPDLDHAAALMREVFADRDAAAQRAGRGAQDIRRSHGFGEAGAAMARRVATVMRGLEGAPPAMSEGPAALLRAEHADALLRRGPSRRRGGMRRLPQKVALRLMNPHTSHQRQVDGDIVAALQAVAREVGQQAWRQLIQESASLRGLRDLDRHVRNQAAADNDRIDDLAGQVDRLRAEVREHGRALSLAPGGTAHEASEPQEYPAAPDEPWSEEYTTAHAVFVSKAIGDPAIIETIRAGGSLPEGYGLGFDERVVEFPWLAGRSLEGTVMDAGSTLNHLHVLRRLRSRMDDLHIVTLAPEEHSYPSLGISYLFADLRKLPLADDVYDTVLSVSTLEHVGLELSHFNVNGGAAADPQAAALVAASELRRVVRPGGEVLITVPIGKPERFAWVRALSLEELDALIEAFEPAEAEATYFLHDDGWRIADRDAVSDARYRDHFSSGSPKRRVVAAEAVACVALRLGGS